MTTIALVLAIAAVLGTIVAVRGSNASKAAAPEIPQAADPVWQEPHFQEIEAAKARLLIEEEQPADLCVLDVRTQVEVECGHIPGMLWIPLDELQYRTGEVPAEGRLLIVCAHGIRSAMACDFLSRQREAEVLNLSGGMVTYSGRVETGLPNA